MKLTISAAARLYGFHRSTLHRHITSGRLSCDHQPDGSRAVDLSELIRCYGEPPNRPEPVRQVATGDATPLQHPDATGDATAATGNQEGLAPDTLALIEELRALRQEVGHLKEEIRELRTLPAPGALAPHEQRAPDQTPAPKPPEPESSGKPRPEAPGSGLSFGDLLARMESRQRH